MIEPQICAEQILLNNPSLAIPLFDLMLKAVEPGFKHSNEYDSVMEACWLKIQNCREAMDIYAKSRAA